MAIFTSSSEDERAGETPAETPAPADPQPPPRDVNPAEPETPEGVITGDGTFMVGTDVQPGQYRTTVPQESFGCYWERLSGTGGEFTDIIANGLGEPGEQLVVTIDATDVAFGTEGCGAWELT